MCGWSPFFNCLFKSAQTYIIKQIHAQHRIWVMNSKSGVFWVSLNLPQLSETSKAGPSLSSWLLFQIADMRTFRSFFVCEWSFDLLWWISNMSSIFLVALCQPPFSCTFNPVWSGSHQLMPLISLPSHHKQTHARTHAQEISFTQSNPRRPFAARKQCVKRASEWVGIL